MFDELSIVNLPAGFSLVSLRSDIDPAVLNAVAQDIFAASAIRRIADTGWYLRMPFQSDDGIWNFEIFDEQGLVDRSESYPIFACVLCANQGAAHDFWKTTMLINSNQIPMPRETPWMAVMNHEGFAHLEGNKLSEGERLQSLAAWAILDRFELRNRNQGGTA